MVRCRAVGCGEDESPQTCMQRGSSTQRLARGFETAEVTASDHIGAIHVSTHVSIEYPGCWQHLRGDVIACSCLYRAKGRSGLRASTAQNQRSIASFAGSLLDVISLDLVHLVAGIIERGPRSAQSTYAEVRSPAHMYVCACTAEALLLWRGARWCSFSRRGIKSRTTCTTAVGDQSNHQTPAH